MRILKAVNGIKDRILGNNLVKFLMRVFQEFGDDDGSTMAASISYYVFLAAFPLIHSGLDRITRLCLTFSFGTGTAFCLFSQ